MNCEVGCCPHVVKIERTGKNERAIHKKCCECGDTWEDYVVLKPNDKGYEHGPHVPKRVEVE